MDRPASEHSRAWPRRPRAGRDWSGAARRVDRGDRSRRSDSLGQGAFIEALTVDRRAKRTRRRRQVHAKFSQEASIAVLSLFKRLHGARSVSSTPGVIMPEKGASSASGRRLAQSRATTTVARGATLDLRVGGDDTKRRFRRWERQTILALSTSRPRLVPNPANVHDLFAAALSWLKARSEDVPVPGALVFSRANDPGAGRARPRATGTPLPRPQRALKPEGQEGRTGNCVRRIREIRSTEQGIIRPNREGCGRLALTAPPSKPRRIEESLTVIGSWGAEENPLAPVAVLRHVTRDVEKNDARSTRHRRNSISPPGAFVNIGLSQ